MSTTPVQRHPSHRFLPHRTLQEASHEHNPRRTLRATVDRLLSKLGLASRSTGRQWIRSGRVRINQRIVRNPNTWATWPGDEVMIDDRPIHAAHPRLVTLHKPRGVVTTRRDEKGRKTIFDGLPTDLGVLHAVGRLDQATSGLLLLTNDTTLSNFLADPMNKIPRVYLVTVRGEVTDADERRASAGILDHGERLQCERMKIHKRSRRESHLEVALVEGKNREIRRLFKALGHEVTRLRRIQFGPFTLGDLPPGAWRETSVEEAWKALRQGLNADTQPLRARRSNRADLRSEPSLLPKLS